MSPIAPPSSPYPVAELDQRAKAARMTCPMGGLKRIARLSGRWFVSKGS